MSGAVVDSSAVLAVIQAEPGSDDAVEWLDGALLSAVNYAEIITKLVEKGVPLNIARAIVSEIGIRVVAYDIGLADRTGELRLKTRHLGLSLADRACLALAERESAVAMTADRNWAALDIGVDIHLIR